MDHYRTLQVSRDAEPEVIDKAYRALSLKYHPDVASAEEREVAHRKMLAINEAYRVLGDRDARRAYDRTLPPRSAPRTSAWDQFLNKGLLGMWFDQVFSGPRTRSR